eukprot:COSAG01_NODE_5973_length_3922_cov_2.839132_3_plen_86_part_00
MCMMTGTHEPAELNGQQGLPLACRLPSEAGAGARTVALRRHAEFGLGLSLEERPMLPQRSCGQGLAAVVDSVVAVRPSKTATRTR